jgi:tetratricopeptide (TPR) repeat protein
MSARVVRALLPVLFLLTACARPEERAIARGNDAAAKGDLQKARGLYQEATRLNPESAHAWALLGSASYSVGDHPAAAEAFKAAQAKEPASAEAARGLATLALEAHDAGAALTWLAGAPELATLPGGRVLQARALLERGAQGDAEGALSLAEALTAQSPQSPDAAYLKGSALVALHRYADAQATFEALLQTAPRSPLGPYGLARLAAAQSRSTDTLLYLRQARTLAGAAWSKDLAKADPAFGFLTGSTELADVLGP